VKEIDILCVGEVLIDFIGLQTNKSILHTTEYARFLGGSPTNVAINASKIGLKSHLVATCGNDGLGEFIIDELKTLKLETSNVKIVDDKATSIILVSKSTETPDFISYRTTDFNITKEQLPIELINKAKIFHTTCFALSKKPAQKTILNRAKKAYKLGLQLSIDINFSEKIWNDREKAKNILKRYLKYKPLVKLSNDDCFRLFNEVKNDDFIFDYFHKQGAKIICLTKGNAGVVVSDINNGIISQEAVKIKKVVDTTGAGDAFWTGFLYAQLKSKTLKESIKIAQELASYKIQNIGAIPNDFEFEK
jgi:fructokinase